MKIESILIEKEINGELISINPTIIIDNNKHILIDCGYEETFDELKYKLYKQHNIRIRDISKLILTHDDIDHIAATIFFVNENPNLQVYCSIIEHPSIIGQTKSERLIQAEKLLKTLPPNAKQWGIDFINRLSSIKRIQNVIALDNKEFINDNIQVINTPGHTKGHISIWLPNNKILIVGDALIVANNEFEIANPNYTLDLISAINSISTILDLSPNRIVCYHGGTIQSNIKNKLKDLIKKYQ